MDWSVCRRSPWTPCSLLLTVSVKSGAEPNFEDDVLIGYLDDSVLISIGISNKQGGLVQVPVEELLASQMACTAGMFVM